MSDQPQSPQIKDDNVLLEVNNLKKYFPITRGIFARVKGYTKAVDDVSFFIRKGETLGLVGESGCGKTTVGRCIVRAYPPTSGEILYRHDDGRVVDLAKLQGEELRTYRKDIRMIFQDPYSSLNPRLTVFDLVSEVLKVNKLATPAEMRELVEHLLRRVGLRPEYMQRYPHAFSGGERQRICIARALITNPRLVVCDEPVSGLDVSIRAQAHPFEQVLYAIPHLGRRRQFVDLEHLADEVKDGQARVERGIRVLENHTDVFAIGP